MKKLILLILIGLIIGQGYIVLSTGVYTVWASVEACMVNLDE